MNLRRIITGLLLLLLFGGKVSAQGTQADYDRAANLRTLTRDKVFRTRVEPQWIDGSTSFWYRVPTGKDTHEFVFVNVEEKQRSSAFDHQRLSDVINASTNLDVQAERLPLQDFQINSDATEISFRLGGKTWICDLTSYELTEKAGANGGSVDDSTDSLKSLTTIPRSSGGGEDTYVRFVNKMDKPIQLFWMAGDGSRRAYAEIEPGTAHDQHTFAGHVWLATTKDGKAVGVFRATNENRTAVIDGSVDIKERQRPRRQRERNRSQQRRGTASPDGKWTAFVRDHNVFVQHIPSDDGKEPVEYRLSDTGSVEDPFKDRLRWSPDSRKLVAIQERVGEKREVHMIESSPSDQLQPKLHTMVYAKPGDNLPVARPRLFDIASRQRVEVSDQLFPNAWRISDVRWQADSRRFTFLYNQRGHQVLRIVVVDAETGRNGGVGQRAERNVH